MSLFSLYFSSGKYMLQLLLAPLSSLLFPTIAHVVKTPPYVKYILYFLGISSMIYHYNCELKNIFDINFSTQTKYEIHNINLYLECLDGISICLISNAFIWKNYKYLFYIQIISIIAYAILKLNYESDIVKNILYCTSTHYFFQEYPMNGLALLLSMFGYSDFRLNGCIWKMSSRYICYIGNATFIGLCMRYFYE